MVALIGRLELVSGGEISHPWDANAYLISGDEPVLIDCGTSLGCTSTSGSNRSTTEREAT